MKRQIGGQGLLDGVMMSGIRGTATAKRKDSGSIDLRLDRIYKNQKETGFRSFPFFRGFFVLGYSINSALGGFDISSEIIKEIFSSEQLKKLKKIFKTTEKKLAHKIVMIMAFTLAMSVFIVAPSVITYILNLFINTNPYILSIIEGVVAFAILVMYFLVLGRNDEISDMFRYHGAEHKSIFCYENGKELSIENVREQKRFHIRCGTNLLFMSFMICSFLYIFISWNNIFVRILLKIVIIPVAASISYEFINFAATSKSIVAKVIAFPGLRMQLLTTKEPTDSQIEVAILALKKAEGLKMEKTIRELLNEANQILKKAGIESYVLDAQLLMCKVLDQNKLSLMMNAFDIVPSDKAEEFMNLVKKRQTRCPIAYLLGTTEFMNIDFAVEEGVLIPRPDTEILVEEVLKHIEKYEELDICDLCCGSGAIGITIAEYRINTKVDLLDIDDTPKRVTTKNIKSFELENRAKFIQSDLFSGIGEKKYDIIVSNPPYIREEVIETLMDDVKNFEPHLALSGGEDGLIFYRRITQDSVKLLKRKAILAFEIGHDQAEEVKTLMEENGFKNISVVKDLAGLDRVVIGNLELV